MVRCHKCIEKGMIRIDAKPEVVFETPIPAAFDPRVGLAVAKAVADAARKTRVARI